MNKDIKLYNRLESYHLNLHTLSERSGVAYSTVYNLFTGRKSVSDATSESLCRIARYLDLTIDELFHELKSDSVKHEQFFSDFLLMWADEVIASVTIGDTTVHIDRFIIHPVKQLFYKDDITRFEFGEILRSRCWDEHRSDIHILLQMIGLDEYNIYAICRKTHGKMVQDKTWFKFADETLTYRDITRGTYVS